MPTKIKTYVLMISRVFPKTHPRSGNPTNFKEKILHAQNPDAGVLIGTSRHGGMAILSNGKLHTIRGSYDLWRERADKINAGEAELSIRQWSGLPYRSRQVEFLRLKKIGVQKCEVQNVVWNGNRGVCVSIDSKLKGIDIVAKNDGLSVDDFCKWFKKDLDGVVIHFTENFRY